MWAAIWHLFSLSLFSLIFSLSHILFTHSHSHTIYILLSYLSSTHKKGAYFHPNTWHNGVYVSKKLGRQRFVTRQGRVHARVSASWAGEFKTLLRVPLSLDE